MHDHAASTDPELLALTISQALILMSWWKALLVLPPFLAWAYVVSAIFDKHAGRFYLGQEKWGLINLSCGVVAIALAFGIPVAEWWSFLIGYALMLLVLGGNIAAFMVITNNQEDKVPPEHKLKLDLSKLAPDKSKKEEKAAAKLVQLGIMGPGGMLPIPEKETPEFELRAAAEELYITGLDTRASRLEIRPTSKEGVYAASYIVDGVRQPGEKFPAQRAFALIDFWKAAADLDVKDRRRRQAAMITVKRVDVPMDCRVVASGKQGAMELHIVYNPKAQVDMQPVDIGMTDNQLDVARSFAQHGQGGVVLLAAPQGQGRTTQLYAVTRLHDAYTSNVQTIEFEPQIDLEGIRQNVFDPTKDGAEFSTTVRSIIRRDPDVVCVSELPDVDTAKVIAQVDAERTRVYVSVKADSALTAAQLWAKAVGDPALAASTLRGVISQRLVRKLCENCKVPFQPAPELLKKLGLPTTVKQLYKKGGQVLIKNKPEVCPVCQGIGYVGQTGIFEVYPIDETARELVAEQNWSGLRGELRKTGLPSMNHAALRTAVEGKTSIEEVLRVTGQQPPKKPGGSGGSKKPAPKQPAPAG